MTTSRCIARDVAQVKRHMYTLASKPRTSSTNSAPVKSTPVTLNGSCIRDFGSGAGSGAGYGFPTTFRHVTQQRSTHLTD